jgi:uncharacterized protein affecting Mg2+/Co2+ transport
MPAYEIPNLRFSGEAGGVIARRRFVTINAQEQIVQADVQGEHVVGVSSQPNSAAGEVAEIYDGIVMVEAGAALNGGQPVMTDAAGRAIPFVHAADAAGVPTNFKAGYAVTTAAALGELVSVKL